MLAGLSLLLGAHWQMFPHALAFPLPFRHPATAWPRHAPIVAPKVKWRKLITEPAPTPLPHTSDRVSLIYLVGFVSRTAGPLIAPNPTVPHKCVRTRMYVCISVINTAIVRL